MCFSSGASLEPWPSGSETVFFWPPQGLFLNVEQQESKRGTEGVEDNIVFQKELAINTADWLADKDGMGFGKLHTLMKQTCNCVLSKVTESIQTIPFFFSPISTFTWLTDCVVLAESYSKLTMAFQGLNKCLDTNDLGKMNTVTFGHIKKMVLIIVRLMASYKVLFIFFL